MSRLGRPKPVVSLLTHADLVAVAARYLRYTRRCKLVVTEAQGWSTSEFPDAIGWDTKGCSILIECKTSVADFRADAVKPFRRQPELGMGALRYYLTPPGLLSGQVLPARWGLLEATGLVARTLQVVRQAERFETVCSAREAPLLVRLVRASHGRWSGWERIWADPGVRTPSGGNDGTPTT